MHRFLQREWSKANVEAGARDLKMAIVMEWQTQFQTSSGALAIFSVEGGSIKNRPLKKLHFSHGHPGFVCLMNPRISPPPPPPLKKDETAK